MNLVCCCNAVALPLLSFLDEEAEHRGGRAEAEGRPPRSFPEEELEEDSEFINMFLTHLSATRLHLCKR